MHEEIKVHVVEFKDRKNLVMRYLDPLTNKHVGRSTGTSKKSDAVKVAAKWEAELQEGRYQKPSFASWEDFREKYETEVLPGLAATTAQKVSSVFNTLERILNPTRVNKITPSRLSYLVAQMRKDGLADATIGGHLAHLQAALSYAVDWDYLPKIPELPKLHRVKRSKTMKGRPITTEEFERMLKAVDQLPKLIDTKGAGRWKFFLRGLWTSGLRIGESLNLYWDRDECDREDCLEVRLGERRPLLVIPASLEKGNEDRLLPMAPEFAEFLESVPKSERFGPVFKFLNRRTEELTTIGKQWAS
ncbi:MAG TPA: hypothetical protein DHW22_02830, partial [Planctomycetaceae bacterium]|nr:hypothetical protein [Planctomycetaceae bacterium]